MPAYDLPFKVDNYVFSVSPSELNRFWFGKPTPFYNGTNIWLNLSVNVSREKIIEEDLSYTWDLITHKDKNLYRSGEGKYHLSSKTYPFLLFWKNIRNGESYTYQNKIHYFIKFRAIHIEPILDFNTYDLIFKVKSKEGIVCQFTLQDVDDYGKNFHINLWSLIVSGLALLISIFAFLSNK
jgi:hypothetical protein